MTAPVQLPPFPVDDTTLDMLMASIDPWGHDNPTATKSSLWDFLTLMSEIGGSDTRAVAEVHDDGSDGGPSIVTMRDPLYTDHCVITVLIAEVVPQRRAVPAEPVAPVVPGRRVGLRRSSNQWP